MSTSLQTRAKSAAAPSLAESRGGMLQRKCACGTHTIAGGECDGCSTKAGGVLRRKAAGSGHASGVPPVVGEVLSSPGSPLDRGTREFMESRFNHDFSRVRVHADSRAAESASAVSALAYTVGRHVVFAEGRYAPQTSQGRTLLAHELAHTIQQGEGSAAGGLTLGAVDDSFERAADAAADAALSGRGPRVASPPMPLMSSPRVQRQPDTGKGQPPGSKPTAGAPDPVMNFEVAGKDKVKWRVGYDTEAQARAPHERIKALHIKVEGIVKEGKHYTFYYYPLTKGEAEAAAAAKEKSAGAKYKVEAKRDEFAKSYYVSVRYECPEAIPARTGFKVWAKCFATEAEAKKQVGKFTAAKVTAEVVKVDEKQFGVYYKPLTEAEAQAAGTAAAKARPGFAEGMYKVKTSEKEDLDTYTYSITTECPKGYEDRGNFHVTSYVVAKESEFPATPTVKDPCGLKGTYRETFLFQTSKAPRGVKMQGTGKTMGGKYVHYGAKNGKDCFEETSCVLTASAGKCATAGRTAAVDFSVIKKGSTILIEDIGERVAEDTGGKFKGGVKKIDIYQPESMSMDEANRATYGSKKVCLKKP